MYRVIKHKRIFGLLSLSFGMMLLMVFLYMDMRNKDRMAEQVQRQCEFQTAYSIESNYCGDDAAAEQVTGEHMLRTLPDITKGVLVVNIVLDETDDMEECKLSIIFGDYSQVSYPLSSGELLCLQAEENAFCIGQKYKAYLKKNNTREPVLDLEGTDMKVSGILADITGRGEDDRLLLFGKDMLSETLNDDLMGALQNNTCYIEYFSNQSETAQELNRILNWLNQNPSFHYYEEEIDQSIAYTYNPSLISYFTEKLLYPILFCCFCNCCLIINVYVKRMKSNIYIRRILGMRYIQIMGMIGCDYLICIFPCIFLIGIISGQLVRCLLAGLAMTCIFALLTACIIRRTFLKEGRCV